MKTFQAAAAALLAFGLLAGCTEQTAAPIASPTASPATTTGGASSSATQEQPTLQSSPTTSTPAAATSSTIPEANPPPTGESEVQTDGGTAAAAPVHPIPLPVLGGYIQAFQARFGRPVPSEGGHVSFKACRHSPISRLSILPLRGQAVSIVLTSCTGSPLKLSEAKKFFPPGSSEIGVSTTSDGRQDRVFVSPVLATAFNPAWFPNCSGQVGPPGAFILLRSSEKSVSLFLGACPEVR